MVVVVVGEWTVRLAEGVLGRGRDERRLEPKVASVLAYLVEHRDRLVAKEELLSALWPDTVVAPIALARSISELRRALGDDPKAPRYVETYAKRGYRLIADVRPAADEPAPHRPALAFLALAAALLLALGSASSARRADAGLPVVVVGAFVSESEAAVPFARGLTEDVFAQLGRVGDVRPTRDGRDAFSPRLDASVRVAGGRLHVRARLAQPGGAVLWTDAFERDASDGVRARQDAAAHVVHGLRVHGLRAAGIVVAGASPRLAEGAPTPYDLFRQSRALLVRGDLASVIEAQRAGERALAQDDRFALGRSGLALALAMRAELTGDRGIARQALDQAQRSVADEPGLAEAHHALGRAHIALRQWDAALRADEAALRLRPSFLMPLLDRAIAAAATGRAELAWERLDEVEARDYPAWRASLRARRGLLLADLGADDAARRWLDEARRLDPANEAAAVALARLDAIAGRRAAARTRLLHWIADHPDSRAARLALAGVALRDGDRTEARSQAEQVLARPGDPNPARLVLAAVDAERRQALLAAVEQDARVSLLAGSEDWTDRFHLAAAAALRGDAAGAAVWYGRAVDAGRVDARADAADPLFEAVRDDAAFREQLRRAGARAAESRARIV